VQAQDVCPGYMAGEVEKTAHGFTAILSLAGAPVCDFLEASILVSLEILMGITWKTLKVAIGKC
jgi:hypothetical protein